MMRANGTQVAEYVARWHGLTLDQMRRAPGKVGRGKAHVSRARQVAMYAMREICPHLSSPMIGRILGRDHSTVLNGCKKIKALAAVDPFVAQAVASAVGHFRQDDGPSDSDIQSAVRFQAMCAEYAKAMRAGA
jgi:chromosomal replication initiation ATPase DnaA